jgi:hypothetical protein
MGSPTDAWLENEYAIIWYGTGPAPMTRSRLEWPGVAVTNLPGVRLARALRAETIDLTPIALWCSSTWRRIGGCGFMKCVCLKLCFLIVPRPGR